MSLLQVSSLEAFYGASQALFGVDLNVDAGQVMALLGRNGMGKSTTVKSICRMVETRGRLEFAGRNLAQLKSYHVGCMGVGLVPEGRRCFATLNVTENLIAAARHGHWDIKRVTTLFPRLAERQGQQANTLSGGEQQMLAIGRALMTNPKLLILDEATEGLAPLVRKEIWSAIKVLKSETGMAILVIDKSLKELAQVCDDATILARGRSVWTGTMSALDAETTAKYVGV